MNSEINDVAVTIEQSIQQTINVTQISTSVEDNMQQMDQVTQDNQKEIQVMNKVISQYKVD